MRLWSCAADERHRVLAVGNHEERHFRSDQTFLEDDLRAGVAKHAVDHRRADRRFGLVSRVGDDDTLACGQPVGLDHHGVAQLAAANRRERLVRDRRHDAISRRRHIDAGA